MIQTTECKFEESAMVSSFLKERWYNRGNWCWRLVFSNFFSTLSLVVCLYVFSYVGRLDVTWSLMIEILSFLPFSGIPNTLNVVSNFPFLIIGVIGLVLCYHENYFRLRCIFFLNSFLIFFPNC